ncbi:hypothetical protein SCHPADRAFT_916441 [Schizopora paradoxa]|uniref:PX domain-containing protein n=1 Tax=Schizopora paradoxa TaxID=27342 RepID=A0A0H2RE66_9AGAM|nr:hypothetical protein SCHPADRAFT_916441 [Schizopora paradoxa]
MLDRNRRDILVRFDAQTNLPNFTGTTYRNISRSYTEFQQFYESIVHSNPQTIVPALPLAQTSAPTDEEDDRLVKLMLQRWLTRVCEDTFLMRDEDTRSFIESDFGYQPTPRPSKRKGSGFSLLKRGVPDEDEQLQRARFELTKLEGQFFDAAKAVDKLARVRKGLSATEAELGNKLISVASTEAHPPLANALRKLGRSWHSVSDLDQAAAISECVIIGDTLGYQGMNSKSAKETLLQRTSVLEEYQAAVKSSISKRRYIERLKSSSSIRPDKVDEALEDLEEANKYEQILAQRVDGISHNLHLAFGRHEKIVEDDITSALVEHARSMISYERQRLRELEALRPDFGNANKTHVPAAPASRPTFIPKLEDEVKPAPPPVRAGTPQGIQPVHPAAATARQPQMHIPSPLAPAPPSKTPLPAQSPGAGPSTPTIPALPSTLIASSTSSPAPSPVSSVPPLGGRFVDGTRSMFLTPSATLATSNTQANLGPRPNPLSTNAMFTNVSGNAPPLGISAPSSAKPLGAGAFTVPVISPASTPLPSTPLATSASTTALPPTPRSPAYHDSDPLGPLGSSSPVPRSATLTPSSFSPLGPAGQGVNGHTSPGVVRRDSDLDPLGLARPGYMSQSLRLPPKPQRPRLDAREAASKLANF